MYVRGCFFYCVPPWINFFCIQQKSLNQHKKDLEQYSMPLLQGDAFIEFRETYDDGHPVDYLDVVRLVNDQTTLINESLGSQFRASDAQRRQSVVYLLEQCTIICSGMIRSTSSVSQRRFRRIRRAVERARRLAH